MACIYLRDKKVLVMWHCSLWVSFFDEIQNCTQLLKQRNWFMFNVSRESLCWKPDIKGWMSQEKPESLIYRAVLYLPLTVRCPFVNKKGLHVKYSCKRDFGPWEVWQRHHPGATQLVLHAVHETILTTWKINFWDGMGHVSGNTASRERTGRKPFASRFWSVISLTIG